MQKALLDRKKAEAEAKGIEWVDPAEAAKEERLHDIEAAYNLEKEALTRKTSDPEKLAKQMEKLDAKYQKKRDKANQGEN